MRPWISTTIAAVVAAAQDRCHAAATPDLFDLST
jgi:hypothetical protein